MVRRLVLFLFLTLGGCAPMLDEEQVRMCAFVAEALHPPGSRIDVLRQSLRREDGHTEVTYRVEEPRRGSRVMQVACGFTVTEYGRRRVNLESVEQNGSAISDVRFIILKRWWMPLFAPASGEPAAIAPPLTLIDLEIPPQTAFALQQFVNALPPAGIYGLLAVAFALIYGLIGRIFLAFGEFATLGGFVAAGALGTAAIHGMTGSGLGLAAALLAVLIVCGAGASLTGGRIALRLRGRDGQAMLIASIGLAIALQEYLRLATQAWEPWLPPVSGQPVALVAAPDFAVTATHAGLATAFLALGAGGLVAAAMARSPFGRQWRACAADPLAATLMGIDPQSVLLRSFALAGALAGLGGAGFFIYYGSITSTAGGMLGLKALVAAVLGGIGSVPGAFIGGIAIGFAETLWSAYFPLAYRDVALFILLAAILALRPGGLCGVPGPGPREV